MASSLQPKILTLRASAAVAKGKAVKFGADYKHIVVGAANTDRCIGIIQNAPTAAEDAAEVAVAGGGGKALLGESVSAGNDLVSHTDGTLVKINADGDEVIARAMQDGAAGDLIDVLIYMQNGHAAQ